MLPAQKNDLWFSANPPTVSLTFFLLDSCHTGVRIWKESQLIRQHCFYNSTDSMSHFCSLPSPSSVLSSWGLDLRGVPGKETTRELLFNQGMRERVCF